MAGKNYLVSLCNIVFFDALYHYFEVRTCFIELSPVIKFYI